MKAKACNTARSCTRLCVKSKRKADGPTIAVGQWKHANIFRRDHSRVCKLWLTAPTAVALNMMINFAVLGTLSVTVNPKSWPVQQGKKSAFLSRPEINERDVQFSNLVCLTVRGRVLCRVGQDMRSCEEQTRTLSRESLE